MSDPLTIAKNVNTSADCLKKLLENNRQNEAVLNAIAIHPNITVDLLIELAFLACENKDYFGKTEQNPVVNLLFIESPNLVEEIYLKCFKAYVTPYRESMDYGEGDIAFFLPQDFPPYYGEGYESLSLKLPSWFTNIAVKHRNEDIRSFLAKNAKTSEDHLRKLAEDNSEEVRLAVAENENTPASVLEKLVYDEYELSEVLEALCWNQNTPASVLEKLSHRYNNEYLEILEALDWKDNVNTPSRVFRELAYTECISILEGIAWNENTPASVLKELASNKCVGIRIRVASNKNTSIRVLSQLARDKDKGVSEAALENKNISTSTLLD